MSQQKEFDIAGTTIKGTFWIYLSQMGGKLMVFITTIVLARVLSKDDFGVAAYAVVAIGFLEVLKDLGIHQAVIYHKRDPQTANAGFWLGLLIGTGLFALTWFLAPLISMFFRDPRTTSLTRALAFTFPLTSLSNVHEALLRKDLAFGRKMVPDVLRSTMKGVISIVFALLGFGPWSLIYGQLGGTVVAVVGYWWILPWRPSLQMNLKLTKPLLRYGFAVVCINAIGMFLMNTDYLFVGRFLGAVALGVYTLAFRAPDLMISQFFEVLGKVIFPVYAKLRDDIGMLSHAYLGTMRYVTMLTLPVSVGLAILARPFVLTVFSAKWADAIPVIPAIVLYSFLRSITFSIGDAYKAQGRLSILVKLSLLQLMMLVPAIWWSIETYGTITSVGWTLAIVTLVNTVLKVIIGGRILKTPMRLFAIAVEPAFIGTAVMGICVFATLHLTQETPPFFQLIVATLAGIVSYGAALWWLRRPVLLTAGSKVFAAMQRTAGQTQVNT
jgi:O-antigen/teichoic acid export membrane protein